MMGGRLQLSLLQFVMIMGYHGINAAVTGKCVTLVQSSYENNWHNLKQIATDFFSAGMH